MKCLIIAAGMGSRLSKSCEVKPLAPILGLPLIERVIMSAKRAGINEFYVVTGHRADKIRPFLDTLKERRQVRITHVTNDEWQKENGLSVLKAKGFLEEPFLLLMGDHLFDEEIIKKLKGRHLEDGEVVLAVDHRTDSHPLVDLKDVTRVLVEDGRVSDIRKELINYNAYDTGIFLCSPAIFDAIEKSITRNDDSTLSGAIRMLASEGKVKTCDIGEKFWIDVDDEKARQNAEKCLVERLKKHSDGPVSRYLNRMLSVRITRFLVKTGITPNQLSFTSFALSLLASAFFFPHGYIYLAIGGMLAQLASIIDGCDGEVARLKYNESPFGRWFDAVLDRYADAALMVGLTWHVYFSTRNPLSLFIGLLALIGAFMNSYIAVKYDGLKKRREEPHWHRLRIGRDVRVFIIFIGAILNQPFAVLAVIALLMNMENIRRIMVIYNTYKHQQRLLRIH